MSLVFYYAPMSTAVTVHWALEELGVPYEKVKVDLQAKDNQKPAFLALNPNAQVPLIVHDGTPIYESVAIMIHLGEAFGVEKKLFPPPGLERAQAFKWLVWTNVSMGSALARYQHASSPRIPAEQHNAAAAAAAKADVEKLLGVLDAALAKQSSGYLVGNSFTLVDLHLSSWASYLGMVGFDTKPYAHISSWLSQCVARPGFATSMKP